MDEAKTENALAQATSTEERRQAITNSIRCYLTALIIREQTSFEDEALMQALCDLAARCCVIISRNSVPADRQQVARAELSEAAQRAMRLELQKFQS